MLQSGEARMVVPQGARSSSDGALPADSPALFHKDPDRRGYLRHKSCCCRVTAADEDRRAVRPGKAAWRNLALSMIDAVAALATTFEHQLLRADGTTRDILALGDVATHPDYRGRGHAAAAVRAAFGELKQSGRDVMLWQTGQAQGFYEKLGARVVPTEKIINSNADDLDTNPGRRAFWDIVAMVYPADAPWDDEETVDLQVVGW